MFRVRHDELNLSWGLPERQQLSPEGLATSFYDTRRRTTAEGVQEEGAGGGHDHDWRQKNRVLEKTFKTGA
jgi:hypothetical protein